MASRQQGQQQQKAGQSNFRRIEDALTAELSDQLCAEHTREVQALYQEQLELRTELAQTVELMQKEILPREKQMHDMIEKMQQTYEAATQAAHSKLLEHLRASDRSAELRKRQRGMVDPMKDMEEELNRIAKLLSHDVVKPDMADWAPARSARSRAPAAQSAKSSPPAAAANRQPLSSMQALGRPSPSSQAAQASSRTGSSPLGAKLPVSPRATTSPSSQAARASSRTGSSPFGAKLPESLALASPAKLPVSPAKLPVSPTATKTSAMPLSDRRAPVPSSSSPQTKQMHSTASSPATKPSLLSSVMSLAQSAKTYQQSSS